MLHRDHKADMLARVPLFASCSKKELRMLGDIAGEISLREGKVLTRQGGPGREFFILLEGEVDVARDGKSINTLRTGDFFGEAALISKKRRNATITTTQATRALVITETHFRRLLTENPTIALKVLEAMAERLAE
jgi:CRP/FNR family transcriptional regulator, cyclic AMP receptor protein